MSLSIIRVTFDPINPNANRVGKVVFKRAKGIHSHQIKNVMLKHNIRIFRRLLLKSPGQAAVNLLGLIIAFTSTLLIYLHLKQELSYDRFHSDSADTYRIAWYGGNPQTRTPHPMAASIKADLPEVVEAVSLSPLYGPGLTKTSFRFKNRENNVVFDEPEGYLVDTTFFKVFDFPFVEGNAAALEKVGGLLISESMAQRFFGNESAIGKFLAFDASERLLEVVAVLKDPPINSHFRFNFLMSYMTAKARNPNDGWFKWGDFGHFNYIKLQPGTDAKVVEDKIPGWITKFIEASDEQIRQLESGEIGFRLQPIESIHLHSHLRWELGENSDISYLYLYGLSALIILVVSIINFVNISTARSMERLKEVGIKKTLGAFKAQLFRQFLTESAITVLLAMGIAIGLAYWLVPSFNNLMKSQLSTEMLSDPSLFIAMILLAFIVTLLAAFYPAMYLSSLDAGSVLKGQRMGGKSNQAGRNILLGIQFVMSILLISGSLLIHKQIKYMKEKDLGFDREQTLVVRIKEDDELVPRLQTVKSEMLSDPNIRQVAAVSNVPGGQFNYNPIFWDQAPEDRIVAGEFLVDYEAMELLGLDLVAGRGFSKSFLSDSAGTSYILNETAVARLNLEDPIGQRITWDDDDRMKEGTIVGVVSDFHFKSLHEAISPIIMQIYPDDYNFLVIKTAGSALDQTIQHIQQVYAKYDPVSSFEYEILDQSLDALYQEESRTLDIITIFSTISIFLSIAGLIGVALVVIRRRIKEIGIRKVLGASIPQILWLLNVRYLIVAAVAIAIAVPATLFFMEQWLNNFTFQVAIDPLIFLGTSMGILLVIIGTISLISFRSSNSNPVKSLRYE